jgi:hypothetical protein
MARLREYLLVALATALVIHLLWLAVAPLIPYLVGGFAVVCIVGTLYHRRRW